MYTPSNTLAESTRDRVSEDMRRASDVARIAVRELELKGRTVTLAEIADQLHLHAASSHDEHLQGILGLALYFRMLSHTGNSIVFDKLVADGCCPSKALEPLLKQ